MDLQTAAFSYWTTHCYKSVTYTLGVRSLMLLENMHLGPIIGHAFAQQVGIHFHLNAPRRWISAGDVLS